MSLRTRQAFWFELLTERSELPRAVDCLAHTGAVELETRSESETEPAVAGLEEGLEEYRRLQARYGDYFPPPADRRPDERPGVPEEVFREALGRVRAWASEADPAVERLEAIAAEEAELARVADFLAGLGEAELPVAALAREGEAVDSAVFLLPASLEAGMAQLPPGVMTRRVPGETDTYLLAVGPAEEVAELHRYITRERGQRLRFPEAPGETPAEARQAVAERRRRLAGEADDLRRRLERLAQWHGLAGALGEIERLLWFIRTVDAVPVSENFAWLTGWTSEGTGDLQGALAECGVEGVIRLTDPPPGARPPQVFHNPAWARPFEIFARLLGTPDRNEADPSPLLAVLVPLLFGYMFGDVGQGAVLAALGLGLRGRYPAAGILIPAGVASMAFGALYGSLFALEILPPLWLRPMDEPLTILLVPLVGGIVVLLLGLLLNGVEALWAGRIGLWWRQEAGVLVGYLGLMVGLLHPAGFLVAALGLLWYLWGAWARGGEARLATLGADAGRLLESAFQLVINTLSFARVGAFALAHSGLALAVESLAHGVVLIGAAVILVVGNVVILALEGLVVSIQITRLMLFEFFVRFLHGGGRPFRPLAAPHAAERGDPTKTDPTRSSP
ncbi:MAG: ATPase [Thiohalospira sp.]